MNECQAILVVDDEPPVCAMLARMLKQLGFRTLQAYSARQAIELYGKKLEEIGLVITDVVMPVVNGPTLARQLQELCPDVKIVFMSGYMEKALLECDNIRVTEVPFLRKPFTAETLRKQVEAALRNLSRNLSGCASDTRDISSSDFVAKSFNPVARDQLLK